MEVIVEHHNISNVWAYLLFIIIVLIDLIPYFSERSTALHIEVVTADGAKGRPRCNHRFYYKTLPQGGD